MSDSPQIQPRTGTERLTEFKNTFTEALVKLLVPKSIRKQVHPDQCLHVSHSTTSGQLSKSEALIDNHKARLLADHVHAMTSRLVILCFLVLLGSLFFFPSLESMLPMPGGAGGMPNMQGMDLSSMGGGMDMAALTGGEAPEAAEGAPSEGLPPWAYTLITLGSAAGLAWLALFVVSVLIGKERIPFDSIKEAAEKAAAAALGEFAHAPEDLNDRNDTLFYGSDGRPFSAHARSRDLQLADRWLHKAGSTFIVYGLGSVVATAIIVNHWVIQDKLTIASVCLALWLTMVFLVMRTAMRGLLPQREYVPLYAVPFYMLFSVSFKRPSVEWYEALTREAALTADEGVYMLAGGAAGLEASEKARATMMENASKDESPFIHLGTSTGFLSRRGDPLAPRQIGQPFGLSVNDLSSHMGIFGASGSGKTSAIIRPIFKQWLESEVGGALILDGKGTLPAELAGENSDILRLKPGVNDYPLIKGLTPGDVSASFREMVGSDGGSENSRFFNDSAEMVIRSAGEVVLASGQDWNLENIYKCVVDEDGSLYRNELLRTIEPGTLREKATIQLAVNFWMFEWEGMDDKTRSNIQATARAWMNKIMSHEDLITLARMTNGIDPTEALNGKIIALDVPYAKYGAGATVINALAKSSLYRAIKKRGEAWEKPTLLLIDECQEVISKDDTEMTPVMRSLGLYGVFSTQNMEGLVKSMGEAAAQHFCQTIRNVVYLNTDGSGPSDAWLSRRLGSGARAIHSASSGFASIGSRLDDTNYLSGTTARASFDLKSKQVAGLLTDYNKANQEEMGAVHSGEKTQVTFAPWIDANEVSRVLIEPNTAIISVVRGRVRRSDLVRLEPIYAKKPSPESDEDAAQHFMEKVLKLEHYQTLLEAEAEVIDGEAVLIEHKDDNKLPAPESSENEDNSDEDDSGTDIELSNDEDKAQRKNKDVGMDL